MELIQKMFEKLSDEQKKNLELKIFEMLFEKKISEPKKNETEKKPKRKYTRRKKIDDKVVPITQVAEKKSVGSKPKYFPVKLHGRQIPNMKTLMGLYGIKSPANTYYKLKAGETFEDIFPEPPSQKNVETLIKKKDRNGNSYFQLS